MLHSIIGSSFSMYLCLPEIWLSFMVCILLVYIVLPGTKKLGQWAQIKDVDYLAIGILLISIWLVWNQLWIGIDYFIVETSNNSLFKLDAMISLIKLSCLLGAGLVILMSREYYPQENLIEQAHNIVLILALLGVLLLISSNDLLSLYLAMELQSLAFYTLATLKREDESSAEAGLKYFILGALSSGIFLFGAASIYGSTGSTNLDQLKLLIFTQSDWLSASETGLSIGVLFLGIALLFKLAAAPFHMWVPDVYQGSPTSITAFFAIVPKISILGLLVRLYWDTFLGLTIQWQPLILLCAITSMIWGSFGAWNQSLLKRLLAYSAISHIGYVLITLVAGTHTSLQALLVYMVIYMVMSIQSFSIILSLRKKLNGQSFQYLIELVALSRCQPLLAFTFTISLLSLAGIPPLAGFFSKWLVFSTAIQSNFYLLAVIGVWTSVLASVYYLRLIINMYARYPISWSPNAVTNDFFHLNILFDVLNPLILIDRPKTLILGSTTCLILFLLFLPTPLLMITHQSALLFLL